MIQCLSFKIQMDIDRRSCLSHLSWRSKPVAVGDSAALVLPRVLDQISRGGFDSLGLHHRRREEHHPVPDQEGTEILSLVASRRRLFIRRGILA